MVLGTANESEDPELLEALNELEDVPEPAPGGEDAHQTDLMIRYIATILDRAGPGRRAQDFDARAAVLLLVEHNWDMNAIIVKFQIEDQLDIDRIAEAPSTISDDSNGGKAMTRTYEETMRLLNPNADRNPAMQNQRDDSKLSITLTRAEDMTGLSAQFNQTSQMDWRSTEMIHALNRWRSQYFRRHLGNVQDPRPRFHPDELLWLTELHRLAKEESEEAGTQPNFRFNWDDIEKDFNHMFEGQVLSGSEKPRPRREKSSLLRQRYRIKAICEVVGKDLVLEDEEDEEEDGKGKKK